MAAAVLAASVLSSMACFSGVTPDWTGTCNRESLGTIRASFYNQYAPPITHTRLTALFPGLPGWARTRKVKPIWILLKQETVSGSGNSWAICKSAPHSRQITMPAPHHSVFYRPDALPAAQPTASKHWKQCPSYHWTNNLKTLKETQSTDVNQPKLPYYLFLMHQLRPQLYWL